MTTPDNLTILTIPGIEKPPYRTSVSRYDGFLIELNLLNPTDLLIEQESLQQEIKNTFSGVCGSEQG